MTTHAQGESRPLVAVVLALPVPGADPLDELAGLPLALRTALTLQKEGAARLALLVPEGRSDIAARIKGDARVKVPVEVATCKTPAQGLASLGSLLSAPFLVGRYDVVVDPAVYRALKASGVDTSIAVLAAKGGQPIGPLLATSELAARLGDEDIDAALARLVREGAARAVDVGSAWAERATTPVGRSRAFHELFEACRKPVDGIVARHINRHISIFISKRIVGLPITPNMMSAFTFLLGALGAVSAGMGGYWCMLLGAFLMQWNSILDGVDGELARVRFQHSKLGQWIDTVGDDLANCLFYAGLAIGTYPLTYGSIAYGPYLGIGGWIGIVATSLLRVQDYSDMIRVGSGDLYAIEWDFDKAPPPGFAGKLLMFWRYVLKKDFAILFFLGLAALGVLPVALFFIGGGSVGALIAGTRQRWKHRKAAG